METAITGPVATLLIGLLAQTLVLLTVFFRGAWWASQINSSILALNRNLLALEQRLQDGTAPLCSLHTQQIKRNESDLVEIRAMLVKIHQRVDDHLEHVNNSKGERV